VREEGRNVLLVVVGIVAVLRVLALSLLSTTGIVVVLAVLLVVVVVRVLAVGLGLAPLGLALMAVAIIVLSSLRMSGHRAGRSELRCRNCSWTVNEMSCTAAGRTGVRLKHGVSQAWGGGVGAYLKQWSLQAAKANGSY